MEEKEKEDVFRFASLRTLLCTSPLNHSLYLSLSLQHQQHPSNENDFLVCTRRRVLWPLNRDRDGVCMRPVSVLVRSNKIMETPQKEKEDERMMMIFLFSQVLAFRPALIYLCVCVCFFFRCCGSAFFLSSSASFFIWDQIQAAPCRFTPTSSSI